jgi:hypothetical protein
MVFILSFAVQGAAGTSHLFPQWWGANQAGNYDRYMFPPCIFDHSHLPSAGVSESTRESSIRHAYGTGTINKFAALRINEE